MEVKERNLVCVIAISGLEQKIHNGYKNFLKSGGISGQTLFSEINGRWSLVSQHV